MASMGKTIFVIGVLLLLPGCEEKQLERTDVIVGDVNDIVAGVGALMESPAGAMLPPDLKLYGAVGLALASIGVNSWQKVRSVLMTKTTKAIVKGIELADKPKTNPMSKVKESIETEMKLAGVLDRGNKLVDRFKLAR
ncbi:hypothetical protein ES705_10639 [subsurface metagenome]